jgi:signal peptidase II
VLKNKYFYLITVTTLSLLIDQLSKIWIRVNIHGGKSVEIISGLFRLVHVENPGAAWGIFADSAYRIPFFIVATLIAFSVIGVYFSRIPKGQNLLAVAISLILGGALGNFIDRLYYRSVTDFLDFYVARQPISGWLIEHFGSNRWPSFNIADATIVTGLLLIMYDMLVLEGRRARETGEAGAAVIGGVTSSSEGGSR